MSGEARGKLTEVEARPIECPEHCGVTEKGEAGQGLQRGQPSLTSQHGTCSGLDRVNDTVQRGTLLPCRSDTTDRR